MTSITVWCKTDFYEKLVAHPIIIRARKMHVAEQRQKCMQYLRRKGARK